MVRCILNNITTKTIMCIDSWQYCGRQTMWIEPLGNCACEGKYEDLYSELINFL